MGDLRHRENDLDGAELWYRRGADLGNTPAMAALGQMLLQSREEGEGVYWLRRTADEGDARACLLVGRWLLDNGRPVMLRVTYRPLSKPGRLGHRLRWLNYCGVKPGQKKLTRIKQLISWSELKDLRAKRLEVKARDGGLPFGLCLTTFHVPPRELQTLASLGRTSDPAAAIRTDLL